MRYFLYKSFTLLTLLFTALFGTFLTGLVLGVQMNEKSHAKKDDAEKPATTEDTILKY
jgi:hypothetical protein